MRKINRLKSLAMLVLVMLATLMPVRPAQAQVVISIADLGDAPDSTGSTGFVAMEAYTGVPAKFPTVFAAGGAPVGPKHLNAPLRYHLGKQLSMEQEADNGFDADGANNIDPAAKVADQDKADDGLQLPNDLPHCQRVQLTFTVNMLHNMPQTAMLNVYADWERDGTWVQAAAPACPNGASAPDWAVQNHPVVLPAPGLYTFQTPAFVVWNPTPERPMWLRVTLSDSPAGSEGAGPAAGYLYGETEDYRVPGAEQPAGSAEPCLAGDPFKLADLVATISSPNPPTAPVLIGQHMTVQFVRSAQMTEVEDDEALQTGAVDGTPQPVEDDAGTVALDLVPMRIFNVRTGYEFRLQTSEAMLKQIYECHAAAGMTEASSPGAPASLDASVDQPSFVFLPSVQQAPGENAGLAAPAAADAALRPAGWSNGDDTRVMRTPTTVWPWRAITQSSSWPDGEDSFCTMTLIGPRHLVTAAHCLVNFGTSDWKSRKLTPGRNGIDVEPYGVSRMTPNPPAGEEAWYIVPEPWIDPTTPDDINKYQWDIGMVLMLDRMGDQTGWMGYGAYTAGDLRGRSHINRGYPRCDKDYAEEPAACPDDADDDRDAVARLYGDVGYCEIGEFHHPGSNGWNRNFSFDCDLSRGHSGSPVYHYRYSTKHGKDVPVVAAVVSWHECTTCSDDDDFPNHARRITPWVRDAISWLREVFP